MLKSIPGLLAIGLSIGAFAPLTYAQNIFQGNGSSVFVMTNDNTNNEVLTYQRSIQWTVRSQGARRNRRARKWRHE